MHARSLTTVAIALVLVTPAFSSVGSGQPLSTEDTDIIVQFHGQVTDQDLDLLRSLGFEGGYLYQTVPAVWTAGPSHAIDDLRHHERVKKVELNEELVYHLSSSRQAVGAQASDLTPGVADSFGLHGEDVTVAVVDTGIDATHPDLPFGSKVKVNHKIVPPVIESVTGFSSNLFEHLSRRNTDDQGHGTHVAGTACGTGAASQGTHTGVAPGCQLVGLGMGVSLSMALGSYGLEWVLLHHEEHNISIVQNSWGIQGGAAYDEDGIVETMIRELAQEGVLPVFSAGNSGPGNGTLSPYAKAPESIGVANYDDRSGRLNSGSSRGMPDDPFRSPDVTAPGTMIEAPAATAAGGEAIGWYTSLTGTSMAAPHVSGIAALLEQADPTLTPAQLKAIITQTARSELVSVADDDGLRDAEPYEVGTGVVDAHRAVGEVFEQEELHAELPGSGPTTTATVTQDTVTLSGGVDLGAPPSSPGGWPVTGTPLVFHDLIVTGINPSSSTGVDVTVLAGETVSLEVRDVVSGHPDVEVTPQTPARFRVTDVHGQTVDLFDAEGPHASDGTSTTGAPQLRVDGTWDVPEDLETGRYTLSLEVDPPGPVGWIVGPQTNVDVDDAGTPAPWPPQPPEGPEGPETPETPEPPETPQAPGAGSSPGAQVDNPLWSGNHTFPDTEETVVFEDDMETRKDGYTTTIDGFNQGILTQWSYVGDAAPLWIPPNSGEHAWYVGLPGAGAASGTGYTDNADSSLVLPTLDLTGLSTAELTYHVSGSSEATFDFLYVEARPASGGTWTELAAYDGVVGNWTQGTEDLTSFVGDQVEIRFRFSSDVLITQGFGWLVDDVRVTGTGGSGSGANQAPSAEIAADPSFGSQSVTLQLDGEDPDGTIAGWTLELGDGTTETGTSLPDEVTHTYEQGLFTPTLTVEDDQGDTASANTTINTVTGVQVDAGDGWVDAVDDSTDGDWSSWHADLDLSGLADGEHTLEARYPDGRGGFIADEVPYTLLRDPVVEPSGDQRVPVGTQAELAVDVTTASGDADIGWDLDDDGSFDDASGTTVQTAFPTAGFQPISVHVQDPANASRETTRSFDVAVFETVEILDETKSVAAAVPDELVTFSLLTQPGLTPQADAYPVNITEIEEAQGGEVIGFGANLTWQVHHTSGLVSINDFDLWAEDPNGTLDSQGATAHTAEQFNATDPQDGAWTLWVTPFLVVEPDTYHVTAEVHVVPS